jgi:DNA polymerase-1
MSKRLVQLDCDMALDFTIDSLEVQDPEPIDLLDFVSKMEFRTLTKRLAEKLKV